MSKDRFRELQTNPSWPTITYTELPQECVNHEDESQGQTTHHESCSISIDDDQSQITDFLQEIETIETKIEKIHDLSQQVKDLYVEMLEHPMKKLGEELDKKNSEINELSHECSKRLKRMDEAQEHSNDLNESHAHRRIRESQVFVLFRRFRDTMAEHHKESLVHRERCKTAIIRELDMTGQWGNTTELEELIENGSSGSLDFAIFIDIKKATQASDGVKARHLDFLKLEEQIRQLRDMFQDLLRIVAEQGEMVDRIEYNVEKAMDYVEVAAENVDTAEKYRKQAAAKKRIITILILITIAVIIVLIFTGSLVSGKILGR